MTIIKSILRKSISNLAAPLTTTTTTTTTRSIGHSRTIHSATALSTLSPRPALNSFILNHLLNTKKKMHPDPLLILKNFAPTINRSNVDAKDETRSFESKLRSQIAFSVASEGEKSSLARFIRRENDLQFKGRTPTTTTSLIPFFGATSVFQRSGSIRVNNNSKKNLAAREKLVDQLKQKCWNLIGNNDKLTKLIVNFIDRGGEKEELIKSIEMMIQIIVKNRRIPYGYNAYLNEVQELRSMLSSRTRNTTSIESVKIASIYQSANLMAQDIAFQLKRKKGSVRSIFNQVVKRIPVDMKKKIEGIRIVCSGRLQGAEIARTECAKYGKTSCNTLDQKVDYACEKVATRYGIVGVKVWISYSS